MFSTVSKTSAAFSTMALSSTGVWAGGGARAFGFMKVGLSSDPANLIREHSLRCSVHRDWDVDEHVVPTRLATTLIISIADSYSIPPPWNLNRDPNTFLSRRGTDQRL